MPTLHCARVYVVVSLALTTACGTICDSTAASERRANQKIGDCNHDPITVHDASTCNSGLDKCSPSDLEQIELYAKCLDDLPQCTSSNSTSFGFARAGCVLQPIGKISGACSAAIF